VTHADQCDGAEGSVEPYKGKTVTASDRVKDPESGDEGRRSC
jgi:hypothetical protein